MKIEKLSTKKHLILGVPLLVVACSSARGDNGPTAAIPQTKEPGPQPDFGALVQQEESPPPISGGTLAVSRTEGLAVAADSDRDRVYVVDLPTRTVRHSIQLAHKAEPGRVALDKSGRAHVALRGTGELATIDLITGGVALRHVCNAPRGVTYDAKNDQVYVACATGELRAFPAAGGGAVAAKSKSMGLDLRDVVLTGSRMYVTRFRSAHIVSAGDSDSIDQDQSIDPNASLAWRAVAAPVDDPKATPVTPPTTGPEATVEETPAVVAQDPTPEPVRTEPGGYGGGGASAKDFSESSCSGVGIVSTRLWLLDKMGAPSGSVRLPSAVLPVDLATNGREFVVVAAGNAHTKNLNQLFIVHREQLTQGVQECATTVQGNVPGQAVAAAFDNKDELVVQTREPAALHIMTGDRRRTFKTIVLATDSKEDTGHAIFHSNAGGNIACASCHAEGADDGRTWNFVDMGARRTPSLLGTTPNTEPFHWSGDMKDLSTLVDHVFVERMSGPKIDKKQVDVLGKFLFTLPAPTKVRNLADVPVRGKDLFEQRCSSCHSGAIMTNNKTVDVGTGGAFQVPSLIGVAWRAPFLHTGCAKTLFDRFDPACGGAAHGDTKDLDKAQIADLVGFLETL
jgi:mono/diheme cytochrome c family protein